MKLYVSVFTISLFCFQLFASQSLGEDKVSENFKPQSLPKDSIITAIGSDSMGPLLEKLSQHYNGHQPDVKVRINSAGSAAATPALVDGTAQLGPMARKMTEKERDMFQVQFGFEPTELSTAYSATAVYVSKTNPLQELSLESLDAIFSTTRKRGASSALETWGALGINGNLKGARIFPVAVSRNAYNHSYFRQTVLLQGQYSSSVAHVSSNKALFDLLLSNPAAIGIAPFSWETSVSPGIKALKISFDSSSPGVEPSESTIIDETYPLSRFLSITFARGPGLPLEPALKDFLSFTLSKEGQDVIRREGLLPLPANIRIKEMEKLQ